jgi:hypothetical protein
VMTDSMCLHFAQPFDPAITRQPRRRPAKLANDHVVGMLIAAGSGRKQHLRSDFSNHPRNRKAVTRGKIEAAITAKVEELNRRADQFCGLPRLGFAFVRGAVRSRFTARTNTERNRASALGLREQDTATAEFDVIRVRTDCEQRELGIRHREYTQDRTRKCSPER